MIWVGVVAQLNRTRSNRALSGTSLPYPLFTLLRHFAHDPEREWTITQLASAFQTRQPGITKRVRKLHDMGLLDERPDEEDRRRKWFSINADGLDQLERTSDPVRALNRDAFADWSDSEIDRLHADLFRLKTHLDENR